MLRGHGGAAYLASKRLVQVSEGWQRHEALIGQLLRLVAKYKGSAHGQASNVGKLLSHKLLL